MLNKDDYLIKHHNVYYVGTVAQYMGICTSDNIDINSARRATVADVLEFDNRYKKNTSIDKLKMLVKNGQLLK